MKLCYPNYKKVFDKSQTISMLIEYHNKMHKKAQKYVCAGVLPEYFEGCRSMGFNVMQQNIKLEDIDKNVKGKRYIIGHSDYRVKEGESIELVNKKLEALVKNGAKVLLCCGDPKEEFDKGNSVSFVANQLKFAQIFDSKKLIIAYEPIYAIGGTVAADINNVMPVIYKIKSMFKKAKVFYGGSVNAGNIEQFFKKKEIDGALIGGASTKFETFNDAIEIARNMV